MAPAATAATRGTEKSAQRMGVTTTSYGYRWNANNPGRGVIRDALDFIDYCHGIGCGGVQIGIGDWDKDYCRRMREKLERTGMYLEGQISLPRDESDLARFDARVATAREAGTDIFRTVTLGTRRYETFDTAEQFQQFVQRSERALKLAETVVRKQRMKLALENHKDWRVPELCDIMRRFSSEYIGICVDTGNSIALLEDPMAVVEAFAPWALTTHFKDMGVRPYPDGFLLAEVPLGEGYLDLKKIIGTLQTARPGIRINLEMITRDPLRIPCFTDKYWATFKSLPAADLARTLRDVGTYSKPEALPETSTLDVPGRLQAEDQNVRRSFAYAQRALAL
jgi:sugar phosphate isomerase/epimerase